MSFLGFDQSDFFG